MSEQSRTIEIPERIAAEIATRIDGTEFETVDEYVSVALEQLLTELRRQSRESDAHSATDPAHETSTESSVPDQLESLGYL